MAAGSEAHIDLTRAEKLASSLSEALSCGDGEEASRLSKELAEVGLPVTVSIPREVYPHESFKLWVGVEDAQSDHCVPVSVEVLSKITILELKEKIHDLYRFHPALQRWVIGRRLARDHETLYSHGVRSSDDKVYLFLLSAQTAHLTRQQQKQEEEQLRIEGIMDSVKTMELVPRGGNDEQIGQTKRPRNPNPPPKRLTPEPPEQPGWDCPACTFKNKPSRPGCEMCSQNRPDDYEIPDVWEPDADETLRLEKEQLDMLMYEEFQMEERHRNYMNLLATDEQDLIPSTEEVNCPVCFSDLAPGEGVVLRECLHTFCRDCLRGTILNTQDAEISCPDECNSKVLDREIAALLTEEEHQHFLDLRLNIAESRSDRSFHCKTPNCRGWCVYEDEVNEFYCPLCQAINCILCRANHMGMNCKDYQDDLRVRAENDKAAQQTKQMLEDLLKNGEAMHCPRCDVVVQKKDGCDWICCVMCKTEICWVTKQARWGPNGNGDISGGCKCRVNNQLCHPRCQNCH
ncbi:ranBP-type and C3HC4-type zinc finger-containing protein 1 [Synchiropus splendidus]|uniref:ranBP-type and C3HC4-type zinc finger-containing protein 1 n=1 Tax=Synchiropus splendidus TaxID=270530 RepID=UPI00237D35BC|nr:ranBP-type and C3HC4-type zinc finger-containing protein 1 [Synchiropus splendidus]